MIINLGELAIPQKFRGEWLGKITQTNLGDDLYDGWLSITAEGCRAKYWNVPWDGNFTAELRPSSITKAIVRFSERDPHWQGTLEIKLLGNGKLSCLWLHAWDAGRNCSTTMDRYPLTDLQAKIAAMRAAPKIDPTFANVRDAIVEEYAPDKRYRSFVDDGWVAIDKATRGVLDLPALADYTHQVAIWGKLNHYLELDDPAKAAKALYDIAKPVYSLRDRRFFESGVAATVQSLYSLYIHRMRFHGVSRTQYSWASKILHRLLPDTVPIYDSKVRLALGTEEEGEVAFLEILKFEYNWAYDNRQHEARLVGDIRDMTLLAAIDTYLWKLGKQASGRGC